MLKRLTRKHTLQKIAKEISYFLSRKLVIRASLFSLSLIKCSSPSIAFFILTRLLGRFEKSGISTTTFLPARMIWEIFQFCLNLCNTIAWIFFSESNFQEATRIYQCSSLFAWSALIRWFLFYYMALTLYKTAL